MNTSFDRKIENTLNRQTEGADRRNEKKNNNKERKMKNSGTNDKRL